MKQMKHSAGLRAIPALATSLITAAMIHTAAALTQVDVLVAYDTTAAAWLTANGTNGADFAAGQIDKMNTVLANSGLGNDFAFRLVGTHDVSFTYENTFIFKTAAGQDATGVNGALASAIESSAAEWVALRTARDTAGADIVVVLVNKGGTSGQMGVSVNLQPDQITHDNLSFKDADWFFTEYYPALAYAVCDIATAQNGYMMMHEVGHIMGAGHSEILSSEPGPQLFPYSAAYMYDGSDGKSYATVMGYDSNGSGDGKRYEVLPYFSSPDLKNPNTDEPLGNATHDNVKTLKSTYALVAAYRAEKAGSDSASNDQQQASDTNQNGQSTTDTITPQRPAAPSGSFTQKTTISGVLKDGSNIVGVIHFIVGKTSKGYSKVSGSVIGLDGKKKSIKAGKYPVEGSTLAKVSVEDATVKDYEGELRAVLGEDGSISNGQLGSLTVSNASSIGVLDSDDPVFTIDEVLSAEGIDFIDELEYGNVTYYPLPYDNNGEAVKVTGDRWSTVAKAGKLKLKKNKETMEVELIPDMGKDGANTNLSGLKISFAKKTATFKGSFTAYAIIDSKLKKYKFAVSGVVVDGVGKGSAFCKNLKLTVPVSVR